MSLEINYVEYELNQAANNVDVTVGITNYEYRNVPYWIQPTFYSVDPDDATYMQHRYETGTFDGFGPMETEFTFDLAEGQPGDIFHIDIPLAEIYVHPDDLNLTQPDTDNYDIKDTFYEDFSFDVEEVDPEDIYITSCGPVGNERYAGEQEDIPVQVTNDNPESLMFHVTITADGSEIGGTEFVQQVDAESSTGVDALVTYPMSTGDYSIDAELEDIEDLNVNL